MSCLGTIPGKAAQILDFTGNDANGGESVNGLTQGKFSEKAISGYGLRHTNRPPLSM